MVVIFRVEENERVVLRPLGAVVGRCFLLGLEVL